MIGIKQIATYIPQNTISNFDLKNKFDIDDTFVKDKVGIHSVSRMNTDEKASGLGIRAFKTLQIKSGFEISEIECLVVVTQNPDYQLPHTSAIIHGKLDLPEQCACFDISLGCSGYVYGLSVVKAFMEQNGLKMGVFITADPYSQIIDSDDKNTSILFGDGATATLLNDTPVLSLEKFNFGTIGKDYNNLICTDGVLKMNGRAIFNFAAKKVPIDIKNLLEKNKLTFNDVDLFIFHQGSKYIVDTIAKRLGLSDAKVPFVIQEYGNTVSSSIPIILEGVIKDKNKKNISISGFGVGLSWASGILKRIN